MKKILTSLLTAYVLTNGQGPPVDVVAQAAATTSAPAAAQTTATRLAQAAATTAAPAAVTTAAATTAAQTAAAATTAAQAAITTAAPAPITPAPVTPAPVTPAPTLNPYCPINAGQQSGIQASQFNENRVCFTPNEVSTDYLGRLRCENFACCQCAQINCGFDGYPCEELRIGDSGAVGVKSINIRGAPEINNSPVRHIFGGNAFGNNGAKIECSGRESCRAAIIRGEMVSEAQCSGDFGCQDSKIVLNDPAPRMNMQCNGMSSCERFDLEINVGVAELRERGAGQACNPAFAGAVFELGKVEFNGQLSGSNAVVTIRNHGCGTLLMDNFDCMSLESCPGIAVNIEGNVAIRNCDLMGVAPGNPRIQSLVVACQAGQTYNNWSPGQQNVYPIPVNPTPVNPTPVNPTPVFPGFGHQALMVDPRSSSMQCDMIGIPMAMGVIPDIRSCANKAITLQIANDFVLDCSLAGACNGMTLTLNAGYDPTSSMQAVSRIDALKFIQATSDVTIYIYNDFGAMGQPVRIENVRCERANACRNLKIIAGPGVDILSTNYDCSNMMACLGATVTQGTMTMPMDPRTQGVAYQTANVPGQAPANPGSFNPWRQV